MTCSQIYVERWILFQDLYNITSIKIINSMKRLNLPDTDFEPTLFWNKVNVIFKMAREWLPGLVVLWGMCRGFFYNLSQINNCRLRFSLLLYYIFMNYLLFYLIHLLLFMQMSLHADDSILFLTRIQLFFMKWVQMYSMNSPLHHYYYK